MNVLVSGLLTAIVIASSGSAVYAQAMNADAPPSVGTQSAPLVTQPASINRLPNAPRSIRPTAPYTSDQLNGLLGTLEANPNAIAPAPKSSIESLIQRFSTSTPKQTTIDPIDFFKPPALNGGFKIPIQQ